MIHRYFLWLFLFFTLQASANLTVPFLTACYMGNLEAVKQLVEQGIDVNVRGLISQPRKNTMLPDNNCLELASMRGHVDVVTTLLQNSSIRLRQKSDLYIKALMMACIYQYDPIIDLIINHICKKSLPYHEEIALGWMRMQMRRGASKIAHSFNVISSSNGKTLLHVAAIYSQSRIANELLAGGIAINKRDDRGRTALHYAAQTGNTAMLQMLLQHKAMYDIEDKHGYTALHLAIKHGGMVDVKILLQNGADMHKVTKKQQTALHLAVEADNDDVEKISLFLEHGFNLNSKCSEGLTPLHNAVIANKARAVTFLLEHGADLEIEDNEGLKPIHHAGRFASAPVIEALVTAGGCVNCTEKKLNQTPLHIAVRCNSKESLEALIGCGADINAVVKFQATPLHVAAFYGHFEIIELLLNARANFSMEDSNGKTPYVFALEHCKQYEKGSQERLWAERILERMNPKRASGAEIEVSSLRKTLPEEYSGKTKATETPKCSKKYMETEV